MLRYNGKFVTICAILLIIYFIYQSFSSSTRPSIDYSDGSGNVVKYRIEIDPKAEKHKWYEKVLLFFYKDKIDQSSPPSGPDNLNKSEDEQIQKADQPKK